jgi:hypothetical protein
MTQERIPFSITPQSVIVMLNGKTYALTEDSHQHYATIREALKQKDFDKVRELIDLALAINEFGAGKIKVVNGVVMYGDHELHNAATTRLLEQMQEGFDVQPMIKFLENIMQNPSKRAVDELYRFLEHNSLPITEDGHFVAYKRVTSNFKDFYTGKMDNSIGSTPEMPRNFVNDNKDETCSTGLHFCSLSYLPHYYGGQGRIVIVKVNPADVVSIPTDYNNAKGRACKYLILEEYTGGELNEKFDTSVYDTGTDEGDDDEFSDDEFSDEFWDDSSSSEYVDEDGKDCWSCGNYVTNEALSDNDGLCPYCDAEIVDEEAETPAPVATTTSSVKFSPADAWPFPTGNAPVVTTVAPAPAKTPVDPIAAAVASGKLTKVASGAGAVYTKEQAAQILGISLDALRKRLDRGVSVQRVTINGVDFVRFV